MPGNAEKTPKNQLVEALQPEHKARLRRASTVVEMEAGDIICETGGETDHVYFPEGAVISLQTVFENGDAVETGSIGVEGVFGVLAPVADGAAYSRAVVQFPGPLRRVPAEVVYRDLLPVGPARDVLLRYVDSLMAQLQQSAACNASHTTRQRMARWLLTMQDHLTAAGAPAANLPYTHDLLSRMLGTTRKSVTLAAQAMQRAGLIRYRRGNIAIVDRPGLQAASCECYAALRQRGSGPGRRATSKRAASAPRKRR
jgi:CRP-like cAMP-binding protein